MKKVTVAHLIPRIPPDGGAELLLLDICRSIDQARFSVVVFYWAGQDGLEVALRQAGAVVVRLPLNKSWPFLSWGPLIKAMKQYRVNILHTHFMDSDLLGFLSGWITGVPMVMHVHSHAFLQKRSHAWRYRLMAGRIARMICVSEYTRCRVVAFTGIAAARIDVVLNGIDGGVFADKLSAEEKRGLKVSLGLRADGRVVGCIARLVPSKRLDVFLESIPFILQRCPDLSFLIVGDGIERTRLQAQATALKISSRVLFTGVRRDVACLLGIMDVFVLPAVGEAFGLSLLEALAAGRPVVVSDDGAFPEIVRNGKEGVLVPPRDPQALAAAVIALLEDPALAARLGAAGVGRAQDFTRAAMAGRLEKIYDEVLTRG